MSITIFRNTAVPRLKKDIASDIVSGAPEQHSQLMFSDKSGVMKSGIWESTAGVFRADYAGIVEFCHILEGSATITTLNGDSFTVTAGDGFVIDSGLRTTWTVETYIKKHFVICTVADV